MNENVKETGGISVEIEHIFPVIKKWLYSDKEIFLREIVSNACDAVTKLKRLTSLGQVHGIEDSYRITVKADKDAKTLTVSDNGIGMTEEEVRKYICQIALSGALDFIEKYEGEDASKNGIIGHFGLGFYSAFMVSDTVEVITRSYTDAPAVRWVCSDAGQYEIFEAERNERGTDIIMHINAEGEEYLDEFKLREMLEKYCSFMPVEIYLECEKEEEEEHHDHEDGCDCEECKHEAEAPKPVNDTNPLWLKNPSDCTEEEYISFYRKVFHDWREPLFYIHINADYPLNFKGILYFPKLNHEYDSLEGQVKLYYNQVFVADNIKEVIPEYLLMLKGVLDCPELPLNVSRSYLQNSGYVAKISAHITKKVADKLNGMFNNDREAFEKLWEDIKVFAEYACLRDKKFYDRTKGSILFKLTDDRHVTLDEYLEAAREKHENVIYYANDKVAQAQYAAMFEAAGIEVMLLDRRLDNQFISMLDSDRSVKFKRSDSAVAEALKGDGEVWESASLSEMFKKVSGNDKLTVKFELLKDASVPAMLNVSEETRRMEDMMKMYRMDRGDMPDMPTEATLVLNSASSLIRRLADAGEESAEPIVRQIWTLALLSQRQLTAEELRGFLAQSYELLEKKVEL